jgi:hypothetical protein
MPEPSYTGDSFGDWPLHDGVPGPITLDWEARTCRMELESAFFRHGEDAQPGVIEWREVTVTRHEAWGPSVFINSQRREGEREFVIEMQSGDEIRVTAGSASLHELHEHRAA